MNIFSLTRIIDQEGENRDQEIPCNYLFPDDRGSPRSTRVGRDNSCANSGLHIPPSHLGRVKERVETSFVQRGPAVRTSAIKQN